MGPHLLRIVIFAAAVGVGASCGDEDTTVSPPGQLEGLVTSVQVRQSLIPPDGRVEFRVAVINYDSEPVELGFETLEHLGVEIQTPDTLLTFPCEVDSATSYLMLPPGGGRIYVMTFSGFHRLYCPDPPDSLAEGHYTIRAGLLGLEERHPWGEDSFTVIPHP